MKGRISILLFVPLVVFLAFAALMWALRVNTLAQDREDMFLQASGHASRLASRLARIAEVNLVDHVGKLEEHVMFASIEMNSSSVVVLDPEGRIVLAHDSSWKGSNFARFLPMLESERFRKTTSSVAASRAGDAASSHFDVLVPFIFPSSAPGPSSSPRILAMRWRTISATTFSISCRSLQCSRRLPFCWRSGFS